MSELRQCKRCGNIGPSYGKCGCTEPRQSDIDELRAKCERLEAELAAVNLICGMQIEKISDYEAALRNVLQDAVTISGRLWVNNSGDPIKDPNTIAVFKEVMVK